MSAFWFRRLAWSWFANGTNAKTHVTLERYINWAHPLPDGLVATLRRK